jgi:hypothetical protein
MSYSSEYFGSFANKFCGLVLFDDFFDGHEILIAGNKFAFTVELKGLVFKIVVLELLLEFVPNKSVNLKDCGIISHDYGH